MSLVGVDVAWWTFAIFRRFHLRTEWCHFCTQRWFPSSQKRSSLNFTSSQRCQLSDVSDGQVSLGFHRSESDVTSSSLAADLVLRGPLLRRLEKQIQLENIWWFRKSFHACMRDRDRSWGRGWWLVRRKWFMIIFFWRYGGYCACKLIRLDLDCFWIWTDLLLWCGANWFWKRVPSVKEDGKTMMRPMQWMKRKKWKYKRQKVEVGKICANPKLVDTQCFVISLQTRM